MDDKTILKRITVEYGERETVYDGYSVVEETVTMSKYDFERLLEMVKGGD